MVKLGMPIEGRGEGLRIQTRAAEQVYGESWSGKVEARAKLLEKESLDEKEFEELMKG